MHTYKDAASPSFGPRLSILTQRCCNCGADDTAAVVTSYSAWISALSDVCGRPLN